jgi:hypothetical protein
VTGTKPLQVQIVGLLIGNWVSSHLLAAQYRFYGQTGTQRPGEVAWHCRWMLKAIRWPVMRRLSGDFDADIQQLSLNLTGDPFRLPPLPCLDFNDQPGIMRTSEYLRLVEPLLRKGDVETARVYATHVVGMDGPKPHKQ